MGCEGVADAAVLSPSLHSMVVACSRQWLHAASRCLTTHCDRLCLPSCLSARPPACLSVCPSIHLCLCVCSGTITVDEMREGLRAKDSKIPEAELALIMANADVNGDGKVDYEEFLAATMHLGKLEREEHLYRAFKVGQGWRGAQAAAKGGLTQHGAVRRRGFSRLCGGGLQTCHLHLKCKPACLAGRGDGCCCTEWELLSRCHAKANGCFAA